MINKRLFIQPVFGELQRNASIMSIRSICSGSLAGLHPLRRMATPFCRYGYTFRAKGCSLGIGMVIRYKMAWI